MEPKDKVILITGASSGIGLCSAHALAREGARVALAARSFDKLAVEVARIEEAGGVAMAVPLDVLDDASVERAVAQVLARFGRVDAVINFAGNGGTLGAWEEKDAAATRAMFDVHLFGAERVARALLPIMRAQKSGAIVNVASTVGWVPMPNAAAYSAAKAAVIAFSAALRGELSSSGIEVMVFAPPHTRTAAGDAWPLGVQTFSPEWVADELVRTLRRGRASWLAGASNRMLLLLQRIAPSLALRIMRGVGLRAGQRALTA